MTSRVSRIYLNNFDSLHLIFQCCLLQGFIGAFSLVVPFSWLLCAIWSSADGIRDDVIWATKKYKLSDLNFLP